MKTKWEGKTKNKNPPLISRNLFPVRHLHVVEKVASEKQALKSLRDKA